MSRQTIDDVVLSPADVQRLIQEPSEETRAVTVQKVAGHLDRINLLAEERKLAEEILRIFADDAAFQVRFAVADSLKVSPNLPRDIANKLARDVEEISLPIVELSPIFEDDDLINLIRSGEVARQVAVARRKSVSRRVSTVMVNEAAEQAVAALAENDGADIAEHDMSYMLERFKDSEIIAAGLAQRKKVPARILEYLVAKVSEQIRQRLLARFPQSARAQADAIINQGRERVTIKLLGHDRPDSELQDMVKQLIDNKRFSESLLLRSLCTGDVRFFEMAMATAAGVPIKNARVLIHDKGEHGLLALAERAGIKKGFVPAFVYALQIAQETQLDDEPADLERHRKKLMERILSNPQGMSDEDVDYLFGKLSDFNVVDISESAA